MQGRNAGNPDFPESVDEIAELEAHLARLGYSHDTIRQRTLLVAALGVPPSQATTEDVLRVLNPGLSAATRKTYLSALRASFRELGNLGITRSDPTAGITTAPQGRSLPRPLAPDAVERLLALEGVERSWTVMGLYAGLRAGDVARLYREDLIETSRGWALSLDGKGNVRATIPAHPMVVDVIQAANRERGPLWRITPGALSSRWKVWAYGALGYRVKFHQCRHTYGTRLYQLTNDLLVVRDLMRHSSVATTQVYTRIDDERGYQAVAGL